MPFTRRFRPAAAHPVPPNHEPLDVFLRRMGWTSDHLRHAIALGFPDLLRLRSQLGAIDDSALQYVRVAATRDWLRGLERLTAEASHAGSQPISFSRRFPLDRAPYAEVLNVLGWTMERLDEAQMFYRFPRERYIEHQTSEGAIRRESILWAHEVDRWVDCLRVLVPAFAMQGVTDAA